MIVSGNPLWQRLLANGMDKKTLKFGNRISHVQQICIYTQTLTRSTTSLFINAISLWQEKITSHTGYGHTIYVEKAWHEINTIVIESKVEYVYL
jgi:hypothetical protein